MHEPTWLSRELVDHIHGALIREHGGSYGIRADDLIESALARSRNRWENDGNAGLPEIAAAYLFELAMNHGYVDGNKRVAFMAAYSFLLANGLRLTAPEPEAYAVVVDVAAGELSEEDLARWLRASVEAVGEE